MKFPPGIALYGDPTYRGECARESAEQITFFNVVRKSYPKIGLIATHIRNEGKRSYSQAAKQKAEGMTKGAPDVIIPGNPSFVCEIKRLDHTQSRWKDGQQAYLIAAQETGSFVCVALGYEAALNALDEWLKT
jgi:hypothetical protein